MDILMLTAIAGLLSGSPAHAADAEQIAYTACAKSYNETFAKSGGKKAIVCGWKDGEVISFTRSDKKSVTNAEVDALVACREHFKKQQNRDGAASNCTPFASGEGPATARMTKWAQTAHDNNGQTQLTRIQEQVKKVKRDRAQAAKRDRALKEKQAQIKIVRQEPVQRVHRQFEVTPHVEPVNFNLFNSVLEAPLQNFIRNYPAHRPQYPAVIQTQPVSVPVPTSRPPIYGPPRQTCVSGPNTGACAIR